MDQSPRAYSGHVKERRYVFHWTARVRSTSDQTRPCWLLANEEGCRTSATGADDSTPAAASLGHRTPHPAIVTIIVDDPGRLWRAHPPRTTRSHETTAHVRRRARPPRQPPPRAVPASTVPASLPPTSAFPVARPAVTPFPRCGRPARPPIPLGVGEAGPCLIRAVAAGRRGCRRRRQPSAARWGETTRHQGHDAHGGPAPRPPLPTGPLSHLPVHPRGRRDRPPGAECTYGTCLGGRLVRPWMAAGSPAAATPWRGVGGGERGNRWPAHQLAAAVPARPPSASPRRLVGLAEERRQRRARAPPRPRSRRGVTPPSAGRSCCKGAPAAIGQRGRARGWSRSGCRRRAVAADVVRTSTSCATPLPRRSRVDG